MDNEREAENKYIPIGYHQGERRGVYYKYEYDKSKEIVKATVRLWNVLLESFDVEDFLNFLDNEGIIKKGEWERVSTTDTSYTEEKYTATIFIFSRKAGLLDQLLY